VAAVAVVCAGCGTSAPSPLGSPVRGPIQTLVTVRSVDAVGNPVGVTSYYPATSHTATAVALLGKLDGPQNLVMTWSRLTSAGPQVLFSQQMTVTSFGRAYSTAVTRGTLPFGTYEVSASVAGVTRTTEWAVFAPAKTTVTQFRKTSVPLTAGRSAALPEPSTPPHLCNAQEAIASMPSPTDVDLNVSAVCPDTGENKVTRGALLATMGRNGGVRLIGMMKMEPGGVIAGNFRVNLCALPGGSDLPGAKLAITTIVYYLGGTRDFTFLAGLPPDQSGPNVSITSSVPAGAPVHPGEKIILRVTATEPNRLGPQVGIKDISLDGPSGLIKLAKYKRTLTGCSSLRGDRIMKVTYIVPASAAKVIKLVGSATDYPGRTATAAISFPFAG
jgi:hypothetical protein